MTTRPIRRALQLLEVFGGDEKAATEAYDAALEAVRAIEEMAKAMLGIRDEPGAIRKAHDLLESIAKEAP